MKQPQISIIIPVYNVEKYLNRCIESVVNQSFKDIEIILVDDGSPDNCPRMCDEWGTKDSRIKVVHKKNEGLGLARNTGMQHATGEYIAFIDSDDYVDLNMYEILHEKAVSHNADIVYCGHKYGLKDGKTYENRSDFKEETIFKNREEIENLSISYFYPSNGNVKMMSVWHSIYNRDVIKTDFYSEREVVSEDLHFQVSAILNSKKIVYIPDSLYYYCYNGESLSNTFKFNKVYGFQKLTKLMLGLYPEKEHFVYMFYFNCVLNFTRHFFAYKGVTSKERRREIRELYSNPIWSEVKKGTNISMYKRHQKLYYILIGKKLFFFHYILSLFDYYIIYKKPFR